ncbi:F0F1 ATP synthase subunit epsilon, partial [Limosilactobacillus fermentum]|nr:F0F1 ATP synthase subunit epsilon [Limosilactobacillus fermentum]
ATIAASSAELPEDIDVARAQSAKERSEALIKKAREAKDADTLDRAEVHLRRAINRLHLSGK